ncbi:MAG TPA: SDR family NAD(P)-dependent oxidoreductase [Thermoanaerobaculia bacterium]|nr:SDR family NAD(P)-dependent oxidoreductase [Thermoanaerobaculia bacterium]
MIRQELLQDSTETYLKSLISEVSGSRADFDSHAPFGELGIDSFHVLKVIRRLEKDFGTLPKSLLFENFTIHDLARYFVQKHEPVLSAKFADRLPIRETAAVAANPPQPAPAAVVVTPVPAPAAAEPIRILEKDAYADPELGPLVRELFERYKVEACVSRGTRRIGPNLFIGSSRRGYFNYGRSRDIILVYGFTGPREYLPELMEEMYRYCESRGFQLNALAAEEFPPVGGRAFTATPFGAMQRVRNLQEFRLDGGPMRRLRYQLSKFEKAGRCHTEEYRCGSKPETDQEIVRVIDRWCGTRTMVNPLVRDVREEILSGTLPPEHRLFLTYLDGDLQNVIMITALAPEDRGYLMDLEFYPPDMPLGGLEFTIVNIIETLRAEGCDLLSLGGTYGCKLEPSPTADPELDQVLDRLREQGIFNDAGNLQFKNKFRPDNQSIFLCRLAGSGNPENVTDIIMMIADPEEMQTPETENFNHGKTAAQPVVVAAEPEPVVVAEPVVSDDVLVIEGNERSRYLAECGFNLFALPHERVELDLKTDSWAQLELPAIAAQMKQLHAQLQQPVSVDDTLRTVFPFQYFALTASGQAAEHVFFKAWQNKGLVPQNLLFPSTIFHQLDNGFTPRELPSAAVYALDSREPWKGNLDLDALRALVAGDRGSIACVCIEVGDNAAGGQPVSLQHLRAVKALLAGHAIPLVLDATRVLENARFLIERDPEQAGRSVWTVAREILSCADAVIGSLTKDFCVDRGGIVATNDAKLFARLQELLQQDGGGIDLIDRRKIALSLQNRSHIEAKVLRRMEHVRRIHEALHAQGVPVVQPAGGHCVLIDVKQVPEFRGFRDPVASFAAWLYVNSGIRAAAHSVGLQKQTAINDLVRLAIPVGLRSGDVETIVERLTGAFARKVNIPEVVNHRLVRYHNAEANVASASQQPVAVVPVEVVKEAEPVAVAARPEPRRTRDIAIVGMAGRYPKAKNLRELWANLEQGRDCIEELPADRFERRQPYGSRRKYRGGFIDDVDKFDSLFFNISPREAEMLDPQERLFLEVAWEALEDAGYYPEILGREDGSRNIGVYVGAVWAMYQMLGVEEKHAGSTQTLAPNSFLWSIANRVSYCFNLSGPSLTVDTACSSSLTALHLACEAIQAGDCSAAIVGGVNLDLHQTKFDINWNGGALSPDGVCRTFGKGANGYVAGEGIGAILVKPLDDAIRNGDNIYGVIKAATVNHGGRTSGYTVPSPKAQADLISAALQKANVDARTIGYVEAHGTGTELGDPIEITGLTQAFQSYAADQQSCAIGSIKTNIGHLEAAAGVVSVTKVLLQMKHGRLAPSLHSAELNEHIDFAQSPFYVVQNSEEWLPRVVDGVRVPLRAGISSFGAGGANAHVILEHYERPEEPAVDPRPLIFPLSARNEEQLRDAATRLAAFLRQERVRLSDVAFTLQQGRKSFEHRLAIVATTQEELVEKLEAFAGGRRHQDAIAGNAKNGEGITRFLNRREKQELVRLVLQGEDPHKIAGLWAEGVLADWQGVRLDVSGRRVSLPTYPFADKRHWAADPSPVRRALQPAAGVHPLIDSNESTFERQIFKKTFHDRDFFIYDHLVSDIPTLPGVAYLELARKAGELAAGRKVRRIRNILWVSPIAVQNGVPKEVFIELKPSGDSVQFEVFSEGPSGKVLHSQGKLLYETREEREAAPELIDLAAVRARCAKVTDGPATYPLFQSFGLNLGPSFRVLEDVYKSDSETLGVLTLPEFRKGDLEVMALPPSLVDGSLQAGVGVQLAGQTGDMFVPYSIGEVEILHPLTPNCFSYITPVDRGEGSRVLKSNVTIVDETGKVLVKIRESVGVPLREVHKKPAQDAEGFANLYYSFDWTKAPLPASSGTARSVVLFADDDSLRLGDGQLLVRPGDAFQDLGAAGYTVDPRSKDDFARLIESLLAKGHALEHVVFAWPLIEAGLSESLDRGVYSLLFLSQALLKHKLDGRTQLLYVFSQSADGEQPQHEAATGFVNALRLEHPKMLCKTVEVRRQDVAAAIAAELSARANDAAAVRWDGGERSIRRLEAFPLDGAVAPRFREGGVYVITGGAGGLGLIFAEFLARECKARLVLTGRSKLTAEREAKLDELRKLGAEVVYLNADVADREDVQALVAECKARFGAIHGVIHSAGVLRDSFLKNKTAGEMRDVLAPKVFGTLHLDELTKDEPLDFFVTFSSLAAVAGNAGQCDYSFANFFMDSFAAGRERLRAAGARSGRTLSLNWSIWADGGMKLDEQTELYFRKTLGIRPLSIETGLDAFARGLATGRSQMAVLEGIQEKIETVWGLRRKAAPAAPATVAQVAQPAAAAAEGDLAARLQGDLTQIVMNFLKLDASDVASDKILLDLGFDSIGLTTFANAINEKYALDITPVLFFDYPSLGEIAKHLAVERKDELLRVYGAAAAPSVPAPAAPVVLPEQDAKLEIRKGWNPAAFDRDDAIVPVSSSGEGFSPELRFVQQPIAIVGMSGVMPQSDDLDEFWQNLRDSKDLITVIPSDRWRWEEYYGDPLREPNKSNSKWGGFMREVDKFDPLFFGISPREAQMMDPQQRIFLEHVWKAIEDSGHKVSDLAGTKTGVFVGVATTDYTEVIRDHGIPLDGYTASGNSHSVLANRVSFLLGLRGPSAPIDTACSSSLIALHRAIESIHTGSCDMAIVGGVQVMLSPAAYISFGMAGMLSSDGKCKTFDKDANGYVRGEGCGAILLKPLAAAEKDGDPIYAVIKSTAENHGGKVTTLTAPNSAAQAELLVEAYEKAQVDPATVGYIECHGTGTSLGDPIEIQALTKAFGELYKRRGKAIPANPHCGLSSVKTNIGHLETAAGIAGILKALLAIRHKQIPANLHLQEINPYINLKGTPFYIANRLTPWDASRAEDGTLLPRRAGVSSFGFGGANAHVVLEEYIPAPRPAVADAPRLIVLSAKNDDRLKAYARSLLAYLGTHAVDLADLAYTLQVGRDEMQERLALVVANIEDLKQKLQDVIHGVAPRDSYRGNTRAAAAATIDDVRDLARVGQAWVAGAKVDWRRLYGANVPRRISAPTYPFARERHWIPAGDRKKVIDVRPVQPVIETPKPAATLQSLVPVWSPTRIENRIETAPSARILVLSGDLEWVRRDYPGARQHDGGEPRDFDQLLWIAPEESDDRIIEQQEAGVIAVFRTVKSLLDAGYAGKKVQWTFVTRRTQAVTQDEPVQAAHAGIAGLVGSLAKEYPNWDLRLVDLESLETVTARECLSLPWDKQGGVLAHRRGQWLRQGLEAMTASAAASPLYRKNGVYVVIGGAGGIGEVWSRYMIEQYQASIVWIGRRRYDDAIEAKLNALTREGRAPLYISADATKLESLQRAYERILKTHPAIHGVVHSAIVLQDQSLGRMDEAAFRAGYSAKTDVSVNIDRVFGGQSLDFMLFFSSIISFFKSPGQANYSAGCTFKDAFAQSLRRKRPYPVKIMNWGYWGGVGAASDAKHNELMARMGIGSIEPAEGMEALAAFAASDVPQMVLIKTLVSEATAGMSLSDAVSYFLTKKLPVQEPARQPRAIAAAPEHGVREHVGRIICETLSEALRLDAATIAGDAPLAEYGVDSIIGVNLVRTINETLEVELEPSKLLDFNTIDALTGYIAERWQEPLAAKLPRVDVAPEPVAEPQPMVEPRPVEEPAAASEIGIEPIAIVGMSGRFAESESLDAFWQHLREGKDLVRNVARWNAAGSAIDSIDQFDPAFFGITAHDAAKMDPQQRLFLEESWKALEDAGYAGASVQEKQCGVFVGCGSSDYDRLAASEVPQAPWVSREASLPARLAYYLNLHGPAIAVDTACSSSLVAIHLACQSLWSRETEMALAGGVFLQATPRYCEDAERAGLLSPDGKCFSFDARANGFVPAEGVGVVVLKRLRDALADGDHVHAVIAGSGVNQDNATNGDRPPSEHAQERLARSIYERFQIDPATIQLLEAHGAGSASGDAIELRAVTRAVRAHTDRRQFCAIGTVKSNIGHAGTASGMAGVLKLLLSLRHREMPPTLHFREANPAVDLEAGPFYVNTALKEWRVGAQERRRGMVSAFSLTGTNAQLVIEEAPAVSRTTVQAPGSLVALSARTPGQLQQQVRNLHDWLQRTPDVSLADLSFTLLAGRKPLRYRAAFVARNREELLRQLAGWSESEAVEAQQGRVRESLRKFGNDRIRECAGSTDADAYLDDLATIADLWAQGYALDFGPLFARGARRIPLPTYPFARERYWIDAAAPAGPKLPIAAEPEPVPVPAPVPAPAAPEPIDDEIFRNIVWEGVSLDDDYEQLTF